MSWGPIIVNAVVSVVTGLAKLAAEAGQPVNLSEVMATAAARSGADMAEYEAQLEEQRKLFPEG